MRIIADLHIHSRYSRATSPDMNLDTIAMWARLKGIDIVGTGDFTHPRHFASIEERLKEAEHGLYELKDSKEKNPARFMLSAEVSNIYKQDGKTRKIHCLIFAPSIKTAKKINSVLARLGNIASDGRPIFGFSAKDLLKITLDASEDAMLVPAHAWTPWFSIFGSKSGFDSIEECFGELSPHIRAIETGLSSDQQMNQRLSSLDNITLISNSDAHSPQKLGREANVFDSSMDYREIIDILRKKDKKRFLFTIEFFPEEGKYHYDGHRECGVCMSPEETKKARGICPVCNKGLTVGVLNRVAGLADRPAHFSNPDAIPQKELVPLQEILSESLDCGVASAKIQREYKRLTSIAGSEFRLLLDMPEAELRTIAGDKTAEAVIKVRNGDLKILPGYDGEYGKVKIFNGVERPAPKTAAQRSLF